MQSHRCAPAEATDQGIGNATATIDLQHEVDAPQSNHFDEVVERRRVMVVAMNAAAVWQHEHFVDRSSVRDKEFGMPWPAHIGDGGVRIGSPE